MWSDLIDVNITMFRFACKVLFDCNVNNIICSICMFLKYMNPSEDLV